MKQQTKIRTSVFKEPGYEIRKEFAKPVRRHQKDNPCPVAECSDSFIEHLGSLVQDTDEDTGEPFFLYVGDFGQITDLQGLPVYLSMVVSPEGRAVGLVIRCRGCGRYYVREFIASGDETIHTVEEFPELLTQQLFNVREETPEGSMK